MKASDFNVTREQMRRVLRGETVCLIPGKDGLSFRMRPDRSFEYIKNAADVDDSVHTCEH